MVFHIANVNMKKRINVFFPAFEEVFTFKYVIKENSFKGMRNA